MPNRSIVQSTSSLGGRQKTTAMNPTQSTATPFNAGERRPGLHAALRLVANSPRPRSRFRRFRRMGIPYARYKAIVLMEVTTGTAAAYRQMATARDAVTRIAGTGVRQRGWIFRSSADPGIPPSRANAYHMRPIEVIDESPHNHIAPPMTIATTLASARGRLWSTM